MSFYNNIDFESLIGHTTIIYGEVDTKKTFYTANFIQLLLEDKKIAPKEISILDFAPQLIMIKGKNIGGRIKDFYAKSKICNYFNLKGEIIPPRLNAKNREELYRNANHNYLITSKALESYIKKPTNILIINDISIYLHVGDEKLLLESIKKCNTFFGNTYYGTSIRSDFESNFSIKERRTIENLLKKVENSFKTT